MKSGIAQGQKKSHIRRVIVTLFFIIIIVLAFFVGFYTAKKENDDLPVQIYIESEENNLTLNIYFSTLIRESKYSEAIKAIDTAMYFNYSTIANYSDILDSKLYVCDKVQVEKLLEYYKKYNDIMFKKLNKSCHDSKKVDSQKNQ
ncbi:hypothetical protein [Zooshikella ganghwensis]|nr:hypothetical protein [Zooshikella ganghwensis]